MRIALLGTLLLALARAQEGDIVRVATTAALREALTAARPGTRIAVAPGTYEGFSAAGVCGAPGKPVRIEAESSGAAPELRGGVQLSRIAHLEIVGLVVRGAPGNGINIDDGGDFAKPSHHVVLRDVTVRDCGGRGNDDGIKMSGVEDFRLERCTVERWGRAGSAVDLVGCHRGVLESCTFRDQENAAAATGVQAKGGSREIVVRRCRFEHAGGRAVNIGGSTGLSYFRPRPEGFEAKDVVVEGCTFVGSAAPVAFVGVDGAVVRWNTLYRPRRWVARILQETREPGFVACRNGVFTNNLVVYSAAELAAAVNVGPATAPETFTFARNYWHCIDEPSRGPPKLPVAEKEAAGGRDPLFRDPARGDFRLREGSPARGYGAEALPSAK